MIPVGNIGLLIAFRGYRYAQPTAKSGFFPAGKYCRGEMRGPNYNFVLNVGTSLCDVSWESVSYGNVPKACPFILVVLQPPPYTLLVTSCLNSGIVTKRIFYAKDFLC